MLIVERSKAHPDCYKLIENKVVGGPKGKWLISSHAYDVNGALSNGFNAVSIPHYSTQTY
jgi:hypothetical protein